MPVFITALIVGVGSFIGGSLRYLTTYLSSIIFTPNLFVGTAIINVSGSFLIGLLYNIFNSITITNPLLKYFFMAGLLGGFTTFSAFSLDFILLLQSKKLTAAIIYATFTILFSILGTFLGLKIPNFLR